MSFQEREDVILNYYSFQPQRSAVDISSTFDIRGTAGRKPGRINVRGTTVTKRKRK